MKQKILNTKAFIDNEFLDKYIELIKKNNSRNQEKFKTERHHILPKCYFKYNNLLVDESIENIVNLLYVDHVLAHYYLSKCSNIDYLVYSNELAFEYI